MQSFFFYINTQTTPKLKRIQRQRQGTCWKVKRCFYCLKLYTTVDILRTIIHYNKKGLAKQTWCMLCFQISKVTSEFIWNGQNKALGKLTTSIWIDPMSSSSLASYLKCHTLIHCLHFFSCSIVHSSSSYLLLQQCSATQITKWDSSVSSAWTPQTSLQLHKTTSLTF